MEDDFALRYVRIYQGVNSRAELVILAPGLRPGISNSGFVPLPRELFLLSPTQPSLDQFIFDIEYIAQIRRFKILFLFQMQKR